MSDNPPEMHRAAESGMAAHWRYKESVVNHRAIDEQVAWARFRLSWQGQLVDDKCRAAGVRIATAMGAGGGSVELEGSEPLIYVWPVTECFCSTLRHQ